MEWTYLSKQGELQIPEELREHFPQGGLVRFQLDAEGRLVIKPVTNLQCIKSEYEPQSGCAGEPGKPAARRLRLVT
ncbi:MAG: hypothetical protein PHC60_07890 [Heliobacteriaceae bacterium]|nr:hypothetical protein [Heliobacteriaceae bacterium]MDD4588292.1 hypothetical protein [Heliobacteriaceae bacterium]